MVSKEPITDIKADVKQDGGLNGYLVYHTGQEGKTKMYLLFRGAR